MASTPNSDFPTSTSISEASTIDAPSSVHLLVLAHGMWGNPGHLAEMERIARETFTSSDSKGKDELRVLIAAANREEGTYDGIDWCAERVVEEAIHRIQNDEHKHVCKFSITGYSFGGLVSRYVVGILAQRGLFSSDPSSGSKADTSEGISMIPMNFNTFATPHLGLPRYSTFFSALSHKLGPKLLSRTGEQFYLQDKWSKNDRPLIDVMSDPSHIFYQALTQFKQLRIFANAVNDRTVPYVTAAIEEEDPFLEEDRIDVEFDPKYNPLIVSYSKAPKHRKKSTPQPSKTLIPLPPFLVKPFPFNILIYLSLPLLIPLAFSIAFIKFSRATTRSRARIRALEETSGSRSLLGALGALEWKLERGFDNAVAEAINDPGTTTTARSSPSPQDTTPLTSGSSTPAYTSSSSKPLSLDPESKSKSRDAPTFTPLQRTICVRLNSLPGLKKEIAFIDIIDPASFATKTNEAGKSGKPQKPQKVRNSHATIVSRDVKSFEFHRIGEGVLRCWAEGLVV
ncbi:putative serine esterase-domain-containing protein [Rhodocollybia butyracea]|uniref:Serine esterase-domain-containing protein n=1 Tax=Rhodocollybia butyracea TaxID=206335 RepID=A0A9P5PY31_9AGAR|nr:putative serine esterase-domain-containing protein [Rhodocollybia butyracea]